MAKHNLFLGHARGKIGSVVFSRLNGVQISRAYNPSPRNPKSWAQATQRAAFASISQYYKVFRYLIEQGQQGIKVGQPSVQDWQSRTLKQLTGQIGSARMVLNAKGVQYPQLLPVSLTNGSLPSLSYDIRKYGHYPATPKSGLCLTFNERYTTTEALAAMTLGDVYAMTPGLQRGFQLTFALLGWTFPMDIFDHGNRANAAMWAQYVIAEDADETLPFFVAVEGQANEVQINPEIITSSWGERFTPRWSLRVIDGKAVAFLDAPEYESPSPGGIIAGCCITSFYNGSTWARSTSPMAISTDFSTTDQTDVIETYQRAAKSTASDLYLNQAKTKEQTGLTIGTSTTSVVAGSYNDEKTSQTLSTTQTFDIPAANWASLSSVAIRIPFTGEITAAEVSKNIEADNDEASFNSDITVSGGVILLTITDIGLPQGLDNILFNCTVRIAGINIVRSVQLVESA